MPCSHPKIYIHALILQAIQDLFIVSSWLQPYYEVTKGEIIESSDNYPIILHLNLQLIMFRERWVIEKIYWPKWLLMLQALTLIWRESVCWRLYWGVYYKVGWCCKECFQTFFRSVFPKCSAPWRNVECQNSKNEKRRLKQILKRHYSIENMNNYKRAAAEFKRTRKKYWRDYCRDNNGPNMESF